MAFSRTSSPSVLSSSQYYGHRSQSYVYRPDREPQSRFHHILLVGVVVHSFVDLYPTTSDSPHSFHSHISFSTTIITHLSMYGPLISSYIIPITPNPKSERTLFWTFIPFSLLIYFRQNNLTLTSITSVMGTKSYKFVST